MKNNTLKIFFILLLSSCSLNLDLNSIKHSESNTIAVTSPVRADFLADEIVQKFDISIKNFWEKYSKSNKSLYVIKDFNDILQSSAFLDDANSSLRSRGVKYFISRIYSIPEFSNPILGQMIKILHSDNFTKVQIILSQETYEKENLIHSKNYVSDFFSYEAEATGKDTADLDDKSILDLMLHPETRGFSLAQNRELQKISSGVNLKIKDRMMTYIREYRFLKKDKSFSNEVFSISLKISYLSEKNRISNPTYRVILHSKDPENNANDGPKGQFNFKETHSLLKSNLKSVHLLSE